MKEKTLDLATQTLSNGLVVNLYPDGEQKEVCMGLVIFSGSRHDPPGLEGIYHSAEHLPFRGTRRYPDITQLMEPVERYSGMVGATTFLSRTIFYCVLPREHAALAAELLAEVVFAPLLQEDGWVAERQVILREYEGDLTNKKKVFAQHCLRRFFAGTGLDHLPIGTPETLQQITVADIRRMYERAYTLANCQLVLTGGLPPDALDIVERYFGPKVILRGEDWRSPVPVPRFKEHRHLVEDPLFPLARVIVTTFTEQLDVRTTEALRIFCEMLGRHTFSSPIYRRLREELQLQYKGRMYTDDASPGITSCGYDCEVPFASLDRLLDEFWGIYRDTLSSAARFEFARQRKIWALKVDDPTPFDSHARCP